MRLHLFLSSHTGTRKDSKTRTILGLTNRIGITNEQLERYVRPLPGGDGRVMLDLEGMAQMDAVEVPMTAEEARICAEFVNAAPVTIADIKSWADALGSKLEEAACA